VKYTIFINQLACYRMGLCDKLDITDLAILDYIHGWCVAPKADRIILDHEEYTRINYAHLIEEMPVLRIREKDTISARIRKIRTQDLIKTFQAKDNTLYVRQTKRCYDLFFSDNSNYPVRRNRSDCPKKPDRLSDAHGQALSEEAGQQQTNNYLNPQITTTEPVVVPEVEIRTVRGVLSAISIPYEGITDRLISDLITEKGFDHVYETAGKIAKQYQPGSHPVSNPSGHFRCLVMEGMEAPQGYVSREEENRIRCEEEKRKEKKRQEIKDAQDDGPTPEEVRDFVDKFCRRGMKDISQAGTGSAARAKLE
jgi:hypothetical protein